MVTRAWGALSKTLRLGAFQTAYSPYMVFNDRSALLQTLKSPSDGLSPLSKQGSFAEVKGPITSKEKGDKVA